MQTATNKTIEAAYRRGQARLLKDPTLSAVEISAGFIVPFGKFKSEQARLDAKKAQKRGQREGVQVFVKVARFSETVLAEQPESGGLLANAKIRRKAFTAKGGSNA